MVRETEEGMLDRRAIENILREEETDVVGGEGGRSEQ